MISFILANVIVDAIFVPINVPSYIYNLAIIQCSCFFIANLSAYCILGSRDAKQLSQLEGAVKKVALLAGPARLDGDTEEKLVLGAQQESRIGKDHLGHWAPDPAITRASVNPSWVLVANLYMLTSCSSTVLFSQFKNLFCISRL